MKQRCFRTWGTIFASAIVLASNGLAQSGGACTATYAIGSTWPGNFQGTITVSNSGTNPITGWTLNWTYGGNQQITQLWNATLTQTGETVQVASLSYNGALPVGGSYSGVGFNATVTGTNSVPAITCTAGGSSPPSGFTLSAAPASVTVTQGASATSTIAIARTGGFAGSVAFSASGLPTGVTASFSATPTSGNSTVVTLAALATAATGPATVTITGTSGGITETTPISLTVNPSSGFSISDAPASLTLSQGTSGTSTITIARTGGFTGTISCAVSGLPSGVSVSFNPASITGSSTIATFAATATATVGLANATITCTSGTTSHTLPFPITVSAPASFTLSASPTSLTVVQGAAGNSTIAITRIAGFSGAIALAASGLPTGVTAAFAPASATGTSSVLTLTASATAAIGPATVTITGTSGTQTATTPITLTIAAPSSFTITAVPTSLTVAPGAVGSSVIRIVPTGGFAGTVTFTAGGLPTGVTAAFVPPSTTGPSSTLNLTVAASAAQATTPITVTGTSGTQVRTATVTLTVSTSTVPLYTQHFLDLYHSIKNTANGYFSPQGVPYHSVETLIVEAPDYGHETVSETYSYWMWLEAMYGNISGDWTGLQAAWTSIEANIIPAQADQPTNGSYNASSPATFAPELASPANYPSPLNTSVTAGSDPIAGELSSTYGTSNIYGMHWIIDSDNFYGYGQHEDGVSKPSYINTFQRGPLESVWRTIPQPCYDIFKYGGPNGYLDLYISPGPYAQQWKYTDAPDADARTIQAMYWAKTFADAKGGNATVNSLVSKATKLGDYLRYSFFDKYFKQPGCTSLNCPAGSGYSSAHYLLSWYYAWGGALPVSGGSWAWRIGSSASHFGYQNPLAAYALSANAAFKPASPNGARDWGTSLTRELEFYRWLQSSNGAIAGGATNSWNGSYQAPPAGTTTFYGMAYTYEPVYHDPSSNQWFGMQAWSMERMAEYYYVTGDPHAKMILDPWVAWVLANTTVSSTGFSIPSNLGWSGQPSLNWTAATANWTTPVLNPGLTVQVLTTSQDIGVAGSLAKALSYYAAGTKTATTQSTAAQATAKALLDAAWTFRDAIGISVPEVRNDYKSIGVDNATDGFNASAYVPAGWVGTMPKGDPINSSSTFLSIRTQYETDPSWTKVQAYLNGGAAPSFNYHRFWAQSDIATAYAVYQQLFP